MSCKTQQQITDKRALTSDGLVMMECNIVSAPGVLMASSQRMHGTELCSSIQTPKQNCVCKLQHLVHTDRGWGRGYFLVIG